MEPTARVFAAGVLDAVVGNGYVLQKWECAAVEVIIICSYEKQLVCGSHSLGGCADVKSNFSAIFDSQHQSLCSEWRTCTVRSSTSTPLSYRLTS